MQTVEKKAKKYLDKGDYKKYRDLMFEDGRYYDIVQYSTEFVESFEEVPFTDGDSMVLCQLAYANLGEFKGKTLREVFALVEDDKAVAPYFHDDCMRLIAALEDSERLGGIRILDARARLTEDEPCQFAVTLFDCGEFLYVAYRGTDDHMVGWLEDIDLSYVEELVSHREALQALNDFAETSEKPLVVGGHSKGGNLALYSSAFCREEVQERIKKVYDHDGPGLMKEIMEREGMKRILPKVDKTCPEMTIFGMILQGEEPQIRTLYSHCKGMYQHYLLNWQLDKETGEAIKTEKLDKVSLIAKLVTGDVFPSTSYDDKLRFRTFVANCFSRADIHVLGDFNFVGIMKFIGAMFRQPCKDQKFMWKMLFVIIKSIRKASKQLKSA